MSALDKETPRPWRTEVGIQTSGVEGPDGLSVGGIWRWPDAQLIVRAVNAHEALLTLADEYRRACEYYARMDERRGDHEGAASKRLNIERIDAALRLARGEG